LAVEAGLLQERDTGGYYDRFRNRFMFPIRTRDGAVVGFGGRALGDAQPKYLNSAQSAIFDKSTLLYGLDLAQDEIRKQDQVVIVEGYMDAIAAHQFGFGNVVAAMGTALTDHQVDQVKRLTKRIALALDADAAGQLATLRGLETAQRALDHEDVAVPDPSGIVRFERKLNAEIAIVEIPEGKDPDELIRKTPERWPELIAGARPFLDFYLDAITAGVEPSDARAKADAVKLAAPILRQVADRVVQAHYIGKLASLLRLDERLVQSEIRRSGLRSSSTPPTERGASSTKRTNPEDHLMAILLQHRSLVSAVIEQVPAEDLMDSQNRELLAVLRDAAIPDLPPDQIFAGLDDTLADHGERLLKLLAGKPAQLPGQIEREARQALERLGKDRFIFLMRQLQDEIQTAQAARDVDALERLIDQMGALAQHQRAFDPPPSPYFRDSRDQRVAPSSRPGGR
jgi:DNA primase